MKLKIFTNYPGTRASNRIEIYNSEGSSGFRYGEVRKTFCQPAFPELIYENSAVGSEQSDNSNYEKYSSDTDYKFDYNIPNNLNLSSEIRYKISKEILFPINVYNNLGHKTAALVNEPQNMRTNAVEFKTVEKASAVL